MRRSRKKIEIPSKKTYKLERITAQSALVANPQFGRRTILVAGTNGKGSTCRYLTHLFCSAGLRVGTYTSPHVVQRGERIRINNQEISELELRRYERKYQKVLEPLSYFEQMTLIAFLYFRDQRVDLQVLEVGMGGRLDATNICSPEFSAIARIDYDHEDVLGKTLTKIAAEKAGILRPYRDAFVSPQNSEALKSIESVANKLGSRIHLSEEARFSKVVEQKLLGISRERGRHQTENARLALSVFAAALKAWRLSCSNAQIVRALSEELPLARIQELRARPLFLVDGSHNLNSIEALTDYLSLHRPGIKFRLIFGVMSDKPVKRMLSLLRPWWTSISFVDFYPERQVSAAGLKKIEPKGFIIEDLTKEISRLWAAEEPVLVAGSLYLAGEVLSILKKKGIRIEQ